MTNQLNVNSGINQLKQIISDGIQTMKDLSGNAYTYAQKAEKVSRSEAESLGVVPVDTSSRKRSDNLQRIRKRLTEKHNTNDSLLDDQISEIVRPSLEDLASHKQKRSPTSENMIDREKLRKLLIEKVKSTELTEELKDLSEKSKLSQEEKVQAELIIHHVIDDQINDTESIELTIRKRMIGSTSSYLPISFKSSYLKDRRQYYVLTKLPKVIQFDDSLKYELTVKYQTIRPTIFDNQTNLHQLVDLNQVINVTNEIDSFHENDDEKLQSNQIEENDQTIELVNKKSDSRTRLVSIHDDMDQDNIKINYDLRQTVVTRMFSRLVRLVDVDTLVEIDRIDQEFEISGILTKYGFEPTIKNQTRFSNIEFSIPAGYERSTRVDDIEISVLDPYLVIQNVYLCKINESNDEVERDDTRVDLKKEDLYKNETISTTDREEIKDDRFITRKISRTIELLNSKTGLIDTIMQTVEFKGEQEDGYVNWIDSKSQILKDIDLRKYLLDRNMESSRDVHSLQVTPESFNIIEKIVVYDKEQTDIEYESRDIIYKYYDIVLHQIKQSRKVIRHTSLVDNSVRIEVSDYPEIEKIKIDGYIFKQVISNGLNVEVLYDKEPDRVEDVINELPDSMKSELYDGSRVDSNIQNSVLASQRLTSLLRRIRISNGQNVTSFSCVLKVLGRYVTEEALADEVFKLMIDEYQQLSVSRVKNFSIKVQGPVHSGSGTTSKIKQYLYAINVICV